MGLRTVESRHRSLSAAGRWWLPIGILVVAGLLLAMGDTGREWLRFDRAGIASAQVWRLVSGHFVHLGASHFALNAAGLVLVWYVVGSAYRDLQWLLVAAVCIVTMDLGLWFLDPRLAWYVGLSGLLHGILAAGLVDRLRNPDAETLALTVLLLGKLAWEQFNGPLPGSESTAGGAVVVDSHLFGALGGALAAIVLRIRVRRATPI
jgi:rhomboid family GlyGly-CTERM serine protease